MPNLTTSTRGSAQEYLLVVACVALVGLVGFGNFGTAARLAIADETNPPSRVLPVIVSGQAAAVEDLARAAKGLYRDVPLKLERTGRRDFTVMGNALQALDEQKLDVAQFGELIGSPSEAPLLHDLYREFLALRDQGTFQAGVYQSGDGSATKRTLGALINVAYSDYTVANTDEYLRIARQEFTNAGTAIPEAYLERIRTAALIYDTGIDEATRNRVFGRAGKGGARNARRVASRSIAATGDIDDLALFLERFEGPRSVPAAFARQYFEDPAGALALIPETGRKYLESEVLPILRAEGDERGVRLVRGEDEADVVTAIVMGDTGGLEGALAKAQDNASGALPEEFDEVAQYAARTFNPFWDSLGNLKRFREEEAESLVRFPDADLEALRARSEGGEVIASTLESLDDVDLVPLPGRPAAHQNKVLEGLVRSVARGLPDEYDRFLGYAAEMFEEIPESLTSHFEQLLERFKRAAQ